MNITILLISTRRYDQFVAPLIKSIEKYFLPTHNIKISLFTDKFHTLSLGRAKVEQTRIPSIGFPEATLFRYKTLTTKEYDTDYLFYMDVDMLVVDTVGDEILGDIVAVRHPGFYIGGGSWEIENKKSTAYISNISGLFYYAGGFQGGKTENYYGAMEKMRDNIQIDKDNKTMACWHDESHWNKYLYDNKNFLSLSPSYCMPEPKLKRHEWRLNSFVPRILALEKAEGIQ